MNISGWKWWHTAIKPAIGEAEARGLKIQDHSGQLSETLSQNKILKRTEGSVVEFLPGVICKVLGSISGVQSKQRAGEVAQCTVLT